MEVREGFLKEVLFDLGFEGQVRIVKITMYREPLL
jgi:hypothetical protein